MKYLVTTTLFMLLVTVAVTAQPRVGYLNPQEVLDNLPEREAIERQLNQFLDQREAEYEEQAIEYQNDMAQFQEEAPDLSEAETRRRQEELQVMENELTQLQNQIQQELEQRQSELLSPVLQEMNSIIEELAEERGLDYVLNEATGQGERFLMFISQEGREQFELTDEVLSRMLNQ